MKIFKKVILFILILFIGFILFILNETKDDINADMDNVESKLERFYNQDAMAGFAVSLFDADSILYAKGFGFSDVENKIPYTTKTLQYIASISKTSIGISLLKAEEMGLLELGEPINQHLPFKVYNPNFSKTEITIKQLATHTSSLDYNEKVVESLYVDESEKDTSLHRFMQDYFVNGVYGEPKFSKNVPGGHWSYSNIGAGLAAYIIEVKSGMSYKAFTQKYIFDPLEMHSTHWFESEADSSLYAKYYEFKNDSTIKPAPAQGVKLYPARDMITNVEDLSRYCQAMMSRDPKLLSAVSYPKMLQAQLENSTAGLEIDNHGIFWMIDRNQYGIIYQLTGMSGGDHCINTMMWFDLQSQLGYIFIGNTGPSAANRLNHIWIYNTLVSLGDKILFDNPKIKIKHSWHNLYNRVRALF